MASAIDVKLRQIGRKYPNFISNYNVLEGALNKEEALVWAFSVNFGEGSLQALISCINKIRALKKVWWGSRHHQAYQLLSQLSSVINFTLPRRRPVIKLLYSGIKIFKYFQISRQNMMERVEYLRKPIQSQIVSPVYRRFLLIFYSSKTFLEVPLQIANCHSFHQIIFYYLFSFTFYLFTTAFSCYSPST